MNLRTPLLFREACLVGGQWVQAASGKQFAVTNPFDDSIVGNVPDFSEEDTQKTIAAAVAAWPAWRDMSARERAVPLRRVHDLMLEHIEDLAMILTLEQGKPLAESRTEIRVGAEYFTWYAEEARRNFGECIPSPGNGKLPITVSQPIGVAALITPWNLPSSMLARKMSAAMAAGCAAISKPASATPFSALALGEICRLAGIPAGIFNVVTGKAEPISKAFLDSEAVRAISFTGSTEVGKMLFARSSATLKKVSLELGGNAPYIVCEDADLDLATQSIMPCKYRNGGQTCISANRILVHEKVYDAFLEKLCAVVKTIKLGNGMDEGTTQGPLINVQAVEAMRGFVDDAVKKGAHVVMGGTAPAFNHRFFEPTILTNVTEAMRVANEEIFGPILPIMTFTTEREAVDMANRTEFGLSAYLFSQDVQRIWRMCDRIDSGMIGVNEVILASGEVPFGGVKQSGLGREGGTFGLEEYMETKLILLGGMRHTDA